MRLLPAAVRPALAVLLVASLVMQVHAMRLLHEKLHLSAALLQVLRESDAEVIATDAFWVPEEMAALWFERRFVFVSHDAQLAALIARLKAIGVRRLDFVAARETHQLSPQGYGPLLRHTYERRRIGGVRKMLTDAQVLFADLGSTPSSRSRTASPPRTDLRPASPR
jgi:hypothetical protein